MHQVVVYRITADTSPLEGLMDLVPLSQNTTFTEEGDDRNIDRTCRSTQQLQPDALHGSRLCRHTLGECLSQTEDQVKVHSDLFWDKKVSENRCEPAFGDIEEQSKVAAGPISFGYPQEPKVQSRTIVGTGAWITPIDRGSLVKKTSKQSRDSVNLMIETKQRRVSSRLLHIPVSASSRTARVGPDVVLVSRRPLEVQKIATSRLLRTLTAIQINDIHESTWESAADDKEMEPDHRFNETNDQLLLTGNFANGTEVEFVDAINWKSAHDASIAERIGSSISSISSYSPVSPSNDADFDPLSPERGEFRGRSPSPVGINRVEKCSSPSTTTASVSEPGVLIINGKTHAHPLRSHPTTPADYQGLRPSKRKFPPRNDSLACSPASSPSKYKRSMSVHTTTRPVRPSFPPRTDSLPMPSEQTTRPKTSHATGNFSRTTIRNKSQLSLVIPDPKPNASHRHSISASFLSFTSQLTTSISNLSPRQAAFPRVDAPAPATKAVPTPDSDQNVAPTKSRNRNASLIPLPSDNRNAALVTASSRNRNASLVPLPSENRRAFVIQQANTSAFSLHSQNSTQDLAGVVAGTKSATDGVQASILADVTATPKTDKDVTEDMAGNDRTTIYVPDYPGSMREPRLRRILNLRRTNAVRYTKPSYSLDPRLHLSTEKLATESQANEDTNEQDTRSKILNVLSPVHEGVDLTTDAGSGPSSRYGSVSAASSDSEAHIPVGRLGMEGERTLRAVTFQGGMVGTRRW